MEVMEANMAQAKAYLFFFDGFDGSKSVMSSLDLPETPCLSDFGLAMVVCGGCKGRFF
ncbi:hypothetical protein HanRHA438_Chr10g0466151 [Helianthus annuus]|nr:hypothetical protein HanRHA438_Chr10g0466151 [Helianthus annuus]